MIRTIIFISLIISQLACSTSQSNVSENDKPIKMLALGDSYTIGESVEISERWPVQLQKALTDKYVKEVNLKIIAKTGWRTDELRDAVNKGALEDKYDWVTLLIGVNDQFQNKDIKDYPTQFRMCLNQALALAKSPKQVIVISIPDYGFTPYGQSVNQEKISKELDQYNEINKEIAQEYGIKYVYITDITRNGIKDPELVATDGLHPSGKSYSLFIPRILAEMK